MQTVAHMRGSWAAGPADNRKEYSSCEGGRLARVQTSQERDNGPYHCSLHWTMSCWIAACTAVSSC